MKIGFLGAGKMAEAMMAAWLESETVTAHELFACDTDAERRRRIKRRLGVNAYASVQPFAEEVELLVLAIKPQDLDAALSALPPDVGPKHLVVSIAAGRRLAWLEERLPAVRLVRVMPNLPCQVAEGMSVYCLGACTKAADAATVETLLAGFGKVLRLPEDRFDAVTALSGSGPAFFASFLDAMAEAGMAEGLDRDDALLLCNQTMLGTARFLLEKRQDPRQLIQAVASPKGTTVAGLAALDQSDFAAAVQAAVRAATQRSRELSAVR